MHEPMDTQPTLIARLARSIALQLEGAFAPPSAAPSDVAVADIAALQAENQRLTQALRFYQRRCDLLQAWQSRMREPERTLVCDILANGATLPDHLGQRYPPAAARTEG